MKKFYLFFIFCVAFSVLSFSQKYYSASDDRYYETDKNAVALKGATLSASDTVFAGEHLTTYTTSHTRGYYFQAQSSFAIKKVMCAEEANPGAARQSVELISFGAIPPAAYPGPGSAHTTLFSAIDVTSGWIECGVDIVAGNYYGIIGAKHDQGSSIMYNSYGNYQNLMIDGIPTWCDRLVLQQSLSNGSPLPGSYMSEPGSYIGRIHFIIEGKQEDIEVNNDPGVCGAVVNYPQPTADGATVTQIDASGLTSGDEFPVGVTVQEYQFDFGGGVTETFSFTVTVNDTEPPAIDCPDNIVVSNDPGECGAIVVYSNFTFSGQEILVDEVLPGSLSGWGVNDTGGNPAFTYTEIESPYDGSTAIKTSVVGVTVSQCPSQNIEKTYNISGNTDETKLKAYLEFTSTMDTYNFPYVVVYLFDNDDNQVGFQIYYGKGVISGIYANYASNDPASFTELSDSSGDMILDLSKMGSDIEFNKIKIVLANYACIGQNSIIFDHLRVINGSFDSGTGTTLTASDNCSGVLVEASIPSGSFFPIGTTPVTLTATDAAGNMTSCTFNVTVNDTEPPVAVCGSSGTGKNVLLLWDTNNANTQSLKTAIEAAGFTVTLPAVPEYDWDGTNPSLDGFDAVIHLNGTTHSFGLPLSAQNALLDFVQIQGKLFIHSEWDAYEVDANSTQPALAPIVILQRESGYETTITYSTVPGYETHPVLEGIPSSFVIDFAGHNIGQVRHYDTYPAETLMLDQSGNAAVAIRELENGRVVGFGHAGNYANSNSLSNANVQQLFINALKWGTNSTGEFEFELDETGKVTIAPEDIDQGSTDNCGIESMELSQTEFTYSDIGTQEVTLTITDLSGNTSTCTAYITIKGGNEEPVVVANPIEVYLDENGIYFLNREDLEEMAEGTTDDTTPFEELKLNAYPHIFRCNQLGEIIHTRLTVEDNQGNVARAWTTVTVLDTIPPKSVCRNIEIYLDENGEAVITPEHINVEGDDGSFDACGIETMALSKTLFGCADVGENTVTLTLTDPSGNSAVCTAIVTVHDTLPPVFEPVADVEVEVEPGTTETAIEYPVIIVTGNCTPEPELIEGLGPEGIFPVGTTTEIWVVEDGGGNTDTLTFVVTVTVMNAPPTIDPVADISVDEDDSPVVIQLTGISDGDETVDQDVTVKALSNNPELVSSIVVDYAGGETGSLEIHLAPDMSGVAEITITVEDSEGASVTETFTLTVNPVNDPPFVVNPIADQLVNASYVLKIPVSPVLGELFDDPEGDEITISAMLEGGEPLPAWAEIINDSLVFSPMIADTGCVHIVVTATDIHGASGNATFQLCVEGYPVSAGNIAAGEFSVNIYPNPARDIVNLEIKSNSYGAVDVSVYTINGKLVLRKNFGNNQLISFSMAEQVSGMYFVKLQMDGKEVVKKLVLDRN